ncbi:type IV pilus biogenesis/stability protein PilW [Aurantivibrio infirmus]
MLQFFTKCVCIILFVSGITACVTTVEGGGNKNATPERALGSYIQLGFGYLQAQNREQARINFNKALGIDRKSVEANEGMALLHQLNGEAKLAEDFFKAAIRYDGTFARVRNNYGNFLFQHERYEEAYKQFEVAGNDLNYERRSVALVNLGRTALKLGNVERAEALFDHALGLDPKLVSALEELAELKFNKGEYALAKSYIDQYGKITKHSARTLWLGIRLERIFGNKDNEASYGLALRNLHPYSQEYLDYKQSLTESPQ